MEAPGSCRACGLGLRAGARFCDGCGAPMGADPALAEYKQVTILLADGWQPTLRWSSPA
jgi:adenylate cyclase